MSGLEVIDPRVLDLEVKKMDVSPGVITVAGYIIPGELNCKVKEILPDESESQKGRFATEKNLEFTYELLRTVHTMSTPSIQADVALKPWTGITNGETVSTVVRVPYGETWPEESWTCNCLCLMVGKQKLRSLILVLGRSLRVSGAWECIGMSEGLDPIVFGNSPRLVIDIA